MVIEGEKAPLTLLKGIKALRTVVGATMGGKGKNVFFYPDKSTHDGVTAARKFLKVYDEAPAKIGARIVLQAGERLESEMGDGTTTATILTEALISNHLDSPEPVFDKEIERKIISSLKRQKLKIKDGVLKASQVAAGDKDLGKLVADIVKKVGKYGYVDVVLGDDEMEVEEINGLVVPFGYTTPNKAMKISVKLDDPAIFVSPNNITTKDEALQIMTLADKKKKRTVAVFAPVIRGDALHTFALNTMRGVIDVICIQAVRGLDDIAIASGAKQPNLNKDFSLEHIGGAKQVKSNSVETIIIGGHAAEEDLEVAVAELVENGHEDRAAHLQGKTAIIRVGGATLAEKEEKLYRVEDAVGSARSALRGGVVVGGGLALVEASKGLPETIAKSLYAPREQLLANGIGKDTDLAQKGVVDALNTQIEIVKTAFSLARQVLSAGVVLWSKDDNTHEIPPFSQNQ